MVGSDVCIDIISRGARKATVYSFGVQQGGLKQAMALIYLGVLFLSCFRVNKSGSRLRLCSAFSFFSRYQG